MLVTHTHINHEDARGVIRDILTHTDFDACTFITFAPGAVRGNHYHAKTLQCDYLLKGRLEVVYRREGATDVESEVLTPGDRITFAPLVHHAYRALEESEMLSFTRGPRQGDEYESDTFRLEGQERLIQ